MTTQCHQDLSLCQKSVNNVACCILAGLAPLEAPYTRQNKQKNLMSDLAFRGVSNLVHKMANYHNVAVGFVKGI